MNSVKILSVCLVALILGCKTKAPAMPPASAGEIKQLVKGCNTFAFELYGQLSKKPGNRVISPYGAYEALAMTSAGAQTSTLQEFRTTLHVTLPEERLFRSLATLDESLTQMTGWPKADRHSILKIANGLWADQNFPLETSFRKQIQSEFRASIENLDFAKAPEASLQHINAWASRATEGRIPKALEELNPQTQAVLANAIYFKGGWRHEFEESMTKPGPFFQLEGGKAEVPLMQTTAEFDYAKAEGCQALEMKFKEGPFAMVLLLPERNRFQAFEQSLNVDRLERLLAALKKNEGKYKVHVTLPKYRFEMGNKLTEPLKQLGLKTAFQNGADFSRMCAKRPVKVDEVLQQVMVLVDEKGAEAAAVTAVTMVTLGVDINHVRPIEFKADHPFIFLIRDVSSGSILFLGRYMKP